MPRLVASVAVLMVWAAAAAAAAPPGAVTPQAGEPRPPAKPNVVLFLVDDMGMVDVGCYGATYHKTPNVDRLAAGGMRFTQAYAAACICSPTRAALLTGRWPVQTGITDWIPGHLRPAAKLKVPDIYNELPLAEVTLAEALRANGYATASVGKWHLGGPDFYPEKHGFDLNVAGTDKGQPPSYFSPYNIATLPDGPPGEHVTDRLTAEAERWVEQNKDRPFFLYLPHFAVHTPIQPRKDLLAKYKGIEAPGDQKNPAYAALVEGVDESVGRLTRKLDELKLTNKTIFVFTSDNGGLSQVANGTKPGPASNKPLRGGKGTLYEGGVRVPLVVRYPGVVKPGTTCDVPVVSQDLFATVLAMTGTDRPAPPPSAGPMPVDGLSLVPLLAGGGSGDGGGWSRDALYWHYPHYHPGGATPCGSIRKGDWKLIETFEDGKVELFDLKADPYETTDLAAREPAKAAELRKALADWRAANGAKMPTPNPAYKLGA
jgi:arylsulfatase A